MVSDPGGMEAHKERVRPEKEQHQVLGLMEEEEKKNKRKKEDKKKRHLP
jgi:hypothetical protein